MLFNIDPIFALIPLILYIVLSFTELNPVLNVFICVVISAVLTNQPFSSLGGVIGESLGSFLGMIGLIIMLGAGLGAILQKAGVAEFFVRGLVSKIGVKTEKRAVITTMLCSTILVALLGTLAGANAIIAPIIIPLVAAVGLTPSVVATCFLGAGLTGMFLGPYTPQVVTIMEITGLDYGTYLLTAGVPLAVVVYLVTFFFSLRTQKKTVGVYAYEDVETHEDYVATKETKRAALAFIVAVIALIAYGIVIQGGASYAILVIIITAIITGIFSHMTANELIETFIAGASRLMWLFIMFILFNPFIEFISGAGAFDRLVEFLTPLIDSAGKTGFAIISALTGIFGIGGAATADNVVMDNMFRGVVDNLGVSMSLWALILLVAGQITSFAYPEADMIGQMGLARSKDVKNLVKYGITVVVCSVILVTIMSFIVG